MEKPRILECLGLAHSAELALAEELTDHERMMEGAVDHWSAKDILAHTAIWRLRTADRLAAAEQGKEPPRYGSDDEINAQTFEQDRHLSWSEVISRIDESFQLLSNRFQAMDDDLLQDGQRYEWLNGQPLWRSVIGNGYTHPITHLALYYLECGEWERATQLQETAAEVLLELDDSPSWRGTTIYNLACHYALCGNTERAISGLREALQLNPDLDEWSRKDSDLDSLRQEPGYLSLYPEA